MRSKQVSVVREIHTLRSTWRGLETWHGRRGNREHKLRPKPARQSPTLPMSGDGKRGVGDWPQATAPIFDSTTFSVRYAAAIASGYRVTFVVRVLWAVCLLMTQTGRSYLPATFDAVGQPIAWCGEPNASWSPVEYSG